MSWASIDQLYVWLAFSVLSVDLLVLSVGSTSHVSEVVELIPAKRRLRCRTTCTNQRGELVVDGEAIEQKDEA